MEQKIDLAEVFLEDVRLLYGNALFEPQRGPNGEGDLKFSATVGFPPDHPAVAQIKRAMQHVAVQEWGEKAGAIFTELKAADKIALRDGAAKASQPGYAGNLFVSASNKAQPLVIDSNKSPLKATSGRPYSGCQVNAVISFWAQDNKWGKRINASLMGVQFLRDGERLAGGGVASADRFKAIPTAGGATTAAGAAPATGGSPDPFA